MSARTQLEIPDDLLQSIQRRASGAGISIEEQMLRDLRVAVAVQEPCSEEALLSIVRDEREQLAGVGVRLTDEFLADAKAWGRK